jgi:ATP adenylyltransferase
MIRRGDLLAALRATTEHALRTGALQPIGTRGQWLEDGAARFSVRVAASLRRKAADAARVDRPPDFNPFLPPEPDLTVGRIGVRHVAVLNKFNVVEDHLLIVTRVFAEQEALLDDADLAALAFALGEYPALGFYNGGTVAGASQRHKHLQVVPLPLGGGDRPVPLAPLFDAVGTQGEITAVPGLPLRHAFLRFAAPLSGEPAADVPILRAAYRRLLGAAGIEGVTRDGTEFQSAPYNLLVTTEWMLVVPRRTEHAGPISVNALGYAGSLFARDSAELELIRRKGPLRILAEVGFPPGGAMGV